MTGVGGIGTGLFFALEGNHTLGRNESRPARLLDARDYCKLHIVSHYLAVLLGAQPSGRPFHVLPIGRVGDDPSGTSLVDEMIRVGIDVRYVTRVKDRPTLMSVCFQYPDGSGGNVTTSQSAASALTTGDIDAAALFLSSLEGGLLAVALPEVPLEVRAHFLRVVTRLGAMRAASFTTAEIPAALASDLFSLVDLVALNEDEASAFGGVEACAASLAARNPDVQLIVTAGRNGAFGFQHGCWGFCPAAEVTVASTAGAGDALLAGVLAGMAAGMPFIRPGPRRASIKDRPLASALDFGVLLASYSVTSPHTIAPDVSLDRLLGVGPQQIS
jgi:sugar/nucleoside kinase (ribokinase family)